jgi:DNA-binding Lrp family transcriptional regulator
MDDTDRKLLNLLQTDFPLSTEPFAVLAERLGISEEEVIERMKALKEQRIIRQISAIFDSAALGYKSSLVAFSVEEDRVVLVSEIVNAHPGVSHNYERKHVYNLWFTITVPPGKTPEAEVDSIAAQARPLAVRLFPTIRLFKIGVAFDMTGDERSGASVLDRPAKTTRPVELSEDDIRAVQALQRDLPLEHKPFAALAREAGMTDDEIVGKARAFLETGAMRRYAAVLHHREAGFAANAMAVWKVPEEMAEQVGIKMAAHPSVSHCYQRPTYPDWPYTIFTMIHGHTPEECEKTARELSDDTGIKDYMLLYSTREFKKTRVKYYEHNEG